MLQMISVRVRPFLIALLTVTAATANASSVAPVIDTNAPIWEVECTEGVCRASQSLKNQESGQFLATLTFVLEADGAAGGYILDVPLGVALRPGVRALFDGEERELSADVCYPDGCRFTKRLDLPEFRSIIGSDMIEVRYFAYGKTDAPIAFKFGVEGLAEAFAPHMK